MLQVRPQPEEFCWRKSSYSLTCGECVEVMNIGDRIAIRDSVNPDQAALICQKGEWRAFLDGVKGAGGLNGFCDGRIVPLSVPSR